MGVSPTFPYISPFLEEGGQGDGRKGIWGWGRDRLRELRHRVHRVNVGSSAQERQHWGTFKPEGYWSLREMFIDGSIEIPEDNELVGQLASLRYRFNSNGQVTGRE